MTSGSAPPLDDELSSFGERLLAVIDEGRRTATYKLALLLALIDLCAENPTASGAPDRLATRSVARRVAELYWPQVKPYQKGDQLILLRQISNRQATILDALRALHARHGASVSFRMAEVMDPTGFEAMIDAVELTMARYPILRLQTVDGSPQPFLYDVSWNDRVPLAQLRQDGWVRFRPGTSAKLVRLAPLVRPLVQLHWTRMVASFNGVAADEVDLHDHLFGMDRKAFPGSVRTGLADLQRGACFYCRLPLQARSDVDHFIPWAKYPNNAVENLVLAHPGCNGHKSNRIAAAPLLDRWCARLRDQHPLLLALADAARWEHSLARSLGLVRTVYGNLRSGDPLWAGPGIIEHAEPDEIAYLLAGTV